MKRIFLFIASFFVSLAGFAQDVEQAFFEKDATLGGDVVIKSAGVKVYMLFK